jgi:hypothetical protein
MPKFIVEMIASYPLVVDAPTMEDAFIVAENIPWEDWPDDECEIVEYCAELVVEEGAEEQEPVEPVRQRPKLTLVRDS